jgi:hypothetical protein
MNIRAKYVLQEGKLMIKYAKCEITKKYLERMISYLTGVQTSQKILILWIMGTFRSHLCFHVRNVEEKCILYPEYYKGIHGHEYKISDVR